MTYSKAIPCSGKLRRILVVMLSMGLVIGCKAPYPAATSVTDLGVSLEYHPETLVPLMPVSKVPAGTQKLYAFFFLKAEYYGQGEYRLYRDRTLYDTASFTYTSGYNLFELTPQGEQSFGAGYYRLVFRNTDENLQIGAREFRIEQPPEK